MPLFNVPEFETGVSDSTQLNQLSDGLIVVRDRFPYARKSSDEIVSNSTALQNDDELVLPLTLFAVYELLLNVLYTAGTAADYKWALTFPAGCVLSPIAHEKDTALAYAQGLSTSYPSGTAVATGGAGIGTPTGISLFGVLTVGGTAGNLQYQWCQNSAVVENTLTYAGSYMRLLRLA